MQLKMSLVIALVLQIYFGITTAQSVVVIPSVCYPYLDYANEVIQSVGLVYSAICPAAGVYSRALTILTSCLSANTGASDRQVATLFAVAGEFCSSASANASASADLAKATLSFYSRSICCGTDVGAQIAANCTVTHTALPSNDPLCVPFLLARTTITLSNAATTATTGASPKQSITTTDPTQSAAVASSSTSNSQSATPDRGLIVGAAVGGSLGFIILLLVASFIIWRRRQHKRDFDSTRATEPYRIPDKAQLHSDDYRPTPKELAGTPLMTVRSVGGLEEIGG